MLTFIWFAYSVYEFVFYMLGPAVDFFLIFYRIHLSLKGSPQTSTPFVRERGGGGVEKYYSPSMVQDPWASLKPVEVKETGTKSSTPNAFPTAQTTRYF